MVVMEEDMAMDMALNLCKFSFERFFLFFTILIKCNAHSDIAVMILFSTFSK